MYTMGQQPFKMAFTSLWFCSGCIFNIFELPLKDINMRFLIQMIQFWESMTPTSLIDKAIALHLVLQNMPLGFK